MNINGQITKDIKQYVMIKLEDEQYGIDISFIDNVVRMQKMTRVPKAQEYFKGVINLRGEIIPVLNLRLKFGLEEVENTHTTRIIILKSEAGAKVGVLVDEVSEVVNFEESSIEKMGGDNGEGINNLIGVGKYNDMLVSLLNIGAILSEMENE